jgi:hypothetical protein
MSLIIFRKAMLILKMILEEVSLKVLPCSGITTVARISR